MREELIYELDGLFKANNTIALERRTDPRLQEFESFRVFLKAYFSVQDQIIRPTMEEFGKYLESVGHRYFIETAQELIEGHRCPVCRIAFHVLLNSHVVHGPVRYPSLCYRTDHTKALYAIKRTGTSTLPIERYELEGVSKGGVEKNLKEFLSEMVQACNK